MTDLPPLPLGSMPEVAARAYNLILGSPYCQTIGGKELLVDLLRLERGLKWIATRDEAAVRALPKKRGGGDERG